jgi:quercetin dioxygenase-like cupin family protein
VLLEHPQLDATWSRYEGGQSGPAPHVHDRHVDAFYIVEGELQFRLGPELTRVRAAAGTFVAVPPGLVHAFDNASDATARWLNFHAPSTGFIAYLRGEGWFDSHDPPADGGRSADDAVVTSVADCERYDRDDRSLFILSDDELLSVFTIAFDPGFTVDPHRHEEEVDSFYVLDGEVEFTVGEELVRAGPETWLSAPPGARHGFRNSSSSRATTLNLHAPDSGFAERIRRG